MGKIKDLTNITFPSGVTAIEFVEIKNRAAYWKCKCFCGKEFITRGADLSNGHTKSCGCLVDQNRHKSKNKGNGIYLKPGDTFGELTILEDSGRRNSSRQVIWTCQCSCGNICYATTSLLAHDKKTHCGCKKILSKGEEKIKKILKNANISFEQEKQFENCVFPDTKRKASFDFFINNTYLIEYDGIQHSNINFGWNINPDIYKKNCEHDNFKNEWCKQNNIPLIRIPYTQYEILSLEDLQLETSNFIII